MDPLSSPTNPSSSSQPNTPPTSAPGAEAATPRTLRRLTLAKEEQHYIFTYEPGRELDVLAAIVALVQDSASGLDWYDAAVLSHQMGQQMTEQLDRLASELGNHKRNQL